MTKVVFRQQLKLHSVNSPEYKVMMVMKFCLKKKKSGLKVEFAIKDTYLNTSTPEPFYLFDGVFEFWGFSFKV